MHSLRVRVTKITDNQYLQYQIKLLSLRKFVESDSRLKSYSHTSNELLDLGYQDDG